METMGSTSYPAPPQKLYEMQCLLFSRNTAYVSRHRFLFFSCTAGKKCRLLQALSLVCHSATVTFHWCLNDTVIVPRLPLVVDLLGYSLDAFPPLFGETKVRMCFHVGRDSQCCSGEAGHTLLLTSPPTLTDRALLLAE